MKRALLALCVALATSSPAVSDVFSLSPYIYPTGNPAQDSPWPYAGMITWTSPADGVANITGDAWATQSTDDVWLEYIPADLPSNYIPGEYLVADLNPDTVLQAGTTPLLGGTVQPPYAPSWDPAQFGTSPAIPCGVGVPWCNGYESPLNPIAVQKGDVIAALIENYNTSTGEIAGLDLNVQFTPSATPTPEPGFWLQAMTLLVTLGLVCRLRLRRT